MKHSHAAVLVTGMLMSSQSAQADRLDPHWQQDREYYNWLSWEACDGDETAMDDLIEAASDHDNPVAMNNWAWVIRPQTDCVGESHDRELWLFLNKESAEAGYPVAMHNWGHILVSGDYGPRDFESGLNYLEEAMMQGYAGSAELLAMIYAEGRHGMESDIPAAYRFYDRAEALGLSAKELSNLDQFIARAAEN